MTQVAIRDQIETLSVNTLAPYARNSRTHSAEQIAQIVSSMREFGFTNPVLIDDAGGIIAGHGRVMAAAQLGLDKVPCLRLTGLSEAQKRAYVIADNKIALNAGWDENILAQEMRDLKAMEFDLTLTGFEFGEIAELLAGLDATPQGKSDPDAVPPVPEKPVTRAGDVWLMGNHRIMCGDSTDGGSVALLLNGDSIDVCFTSPPYNLGENVALSTRKGRKNAYVEYQDNAKVGEWLGLVQSVLNIARSVAKYQFFNIQMLAGNKCDLSEFIGANRNHLVDIGVWTKRNPQPAVAEGVMNSAMEFMFIFSSDEKPTRRLPGAFRGTLSNVFDGTVNSENKESATHSAAMPVGLPIHFLSQLDVFSIYEPFCGTGTTIIAAEQTGRRCYAMELSPQYVDVAVRRWQQYTGKRATLESTGQPFPE